MTPQEQAHDDTSELSAPARVLVAVAAAVVAGAVLFHLAMVSLYVAPSNALRNQYSETITGYVSPEFVQNWKLFAPEPLHVNTAVHARAQLRNADGTSEITGWINISAKDIDDTRFNLVPSHTRNQLRKGWRTFTNTHDAENRPLNLTGSLVASYLKRMALLRLSAELPADAIEQVQLKSATKRVPEPEWSERNTRTGTSYRVLPWWPVGSDDFPEGSRR